MTLAMTIGIAVFAVMVVMVLIGFPVFISMMLCSFAGLMFIGGSNMAITQFTTGIFSLSATYKFAILPLFMLMGVLAGETGIAGGAFDAGRVWTGRIRGGLLMGTVCANLIFGACSGMSVAANAVFGKIAYPQLKKHGYDESLSLGTIAATGALSSLIPPSMTIIVLCVLVDLSVGQALLTSLFTGILTAVAFIVAIMIIIRVKPGMAPKVTEEDLAVTMREKVGTLKLLIPIIALFGLIISGSFFGWFSATVAGAIGAFAILVYAVARRMKTRRLWLIIKEAVKMNAQVFPMIIGGMMFSRLITVSGLADGMAGAVANSGLSKYAVFFLLVAVYIGLGCIMDIMSIIIITAPMVFPILSAAGFDEYVVCVVIVFICEIGGLTPPIGMNVFATASVLRIDPGRIFKGVVPFFIVDIAMIVLLAFFPQITTWLPALMR
jgi:tripartite ATP-independent transporter DctM subunit